MLVGDPFKMEIWRILASLPLLNLFIVSVLQTIGHSPPVSRNFYWIPNVVKFMVLAGRLCCQSLKSVGAFTVSRPADLSLGNCSSLLKTCFQAFQDG